MTFFEILVPYIYFLKSKAIILFVTVTLGIIFVIMLIAKNVIFLLFFTFSCKIVVLISIYPIFSHIIMFIRFLSIINMGLDTKIKLLAALHGQILQKVKIMAAILENGRYRKS